jgi:hypothetical protein
MIDYKLLVASEQEKIKALTEKYHVQKRLLTAIETDLIEAREALRKAQDALEGQAEERACRSSLDVAQDEEVAAFVKKLPALLEKVAKEPRLEYIGIGGLTT